MFIWKWARSAGCWQRKGSRGSLGFARDDRGAISLGLVPRRWRSHGRPGQAGRPDHLRDVAPALPSLCENSEIPNSVPQGRLKMTQDDVLGALNHSPKSRLTQDSVLGHSQPSLAGLFPALLYHPGLASWATFSTFSRPYGTELVCGVLTRTRSGWVPTARGTGTFSGRPTGPRIHGAFAVSFRLH